MLCGSTRSAGIHINARQVGAKQSVPDLEAQRNSQIKSVTMSIFAQGENRSTRTKTLGVRLRSTSRSSHAIPGIQSPVIEVGDTSADNYNNPTPSLG